MKKHIVIINQTAGSAKHGMVFRNYYLAKEWVAKGNQVTIITASYFHNFTTFPQTNGLFTEEKIDGIDYIWVKIPKYSESRSLGRVLAIFIFPLLLTLFPFWKLNKPNAIIVSGPPHTSILHAWMWARLRGAKLIYEVRDIWPLTVIKLGNVSEWHPFILALSFFERLAYLLSDKVVSVLRFANEHFESKGMNPNKFVYIPNGFDISKTNDVESQASRELAYLAKHKKIVIYAGSLGLANNLDQLIDAASLLKDNSEIVFVIMGRGPYKDHLLERSKGLPNIKFFEAVPKSDVAQVLNQASVAYIGLMKSDLFRHGISPNKLFDYMAASLPVVMAIDTKDNIVENANCGIHVASCSPQDIAGAVLELCQKTKEELKVIGMSGRNYLENNHSYEALSNRYLENI